MMHRRIIVKHCMSVWQSICVFSYRFKIIITVLLFWLRYLLLKSAIKSKIGVKANCYRPGCWSFFVIDGIFIWLIFTSRKRCDSLIYITLYITTIITGDRWGSDWFDSPSVHLLLDRFNHRPRIPSRQERSKQKILSQDFHCWHS